MAYVDGFVTPVRTDDRDAYLEMAQIAAAVFKENGASRVVECWADDVPHGTLTDFYRAVKAEEQETVVLSWVEWPSKDIRDAGMAKTVEDPRLQPGDAPPPFDMKRLIFGGFTPILDQ